ncbi:MAG TPA: hypothetical protein VHH73_04375, partial [Verrucomicrobiae bacterium]|nr:hypothetical protein [Verrucomicrobiae bacterium]
METDILGAYQSAPNVRQRSRRFKAVVLSLAATVLLAVGFYFARNPLLNRCARPRLEHAFAAHVPGAALRLGALHYDFFRNRLQCDGVDLTLPDGAPLSTGPVVVEGGLWVRLLIGQSNPEQLLRAAQIELTELSARWPSGDYRVRCGDLRISVLDAEIAARALNFQPLVNDDAFFAADDFRRVRYRFVAAACT